MNVVTTAHETGAPANNSHILQFSIVETLIEQLQETVNRDALPSIADDKNCIEGIKFGDPNASRLLIRRYRGVVAAVVHANYQPSAYKKNMLIAGTEGLLQAAMLYDPNGEEAFVDVAIPEIAKHIGGKSLESLTPKDETSRPAEALFSYLGTIAEQDKITPEMGIAQVMKRLSPVERQVAELLHLPFPEIAEKLELDQKNAKQVTDAVQRIKTKLGVTTRSVIGAALELQRRGMNYPVRTPEKPLVKIFTNEQLDVGLVLDQSYKDIAAEAKIDPNSVGHYVERMRKAVGVDTTMELALIIDKHDTGERPDPRLQQLADSLGVPSISGLDEIRPRLDILANRERQSIELYFDSKEPRNWTAVGAEMELKNPADAANYAARGFRKLRAA